MGELAVLRSTKPRYKTKGRATCLNLRSLLVAPSNRISRDMTDYVRTYVTLGETEVSLIDGCGLTRRLMVHLCILTQELGGKRPKCIEPLEIDQTLSKAGG